MESLVPMINYLLPLEEDPVMQVVNCNELPRVFTTDTDQQNLSWSNFV